MSCYSFKIDGLTLEGVREKEKDCAFLFSLAFGIIIPTFSLSGCKGGSPRSAGIAKSSHLCAAKSSKILFQPFLLATQRNPTIDPLRHWPKISLNRLSPAIDPFRVFHLFRLNFAVLLPLLDAVYSWLWLLHFTFILPVLQYSGAPHLAAAPGNTGIFRKTGAADMQMSLTKQHLHFPIVSFGVSWDALVLHIARNTALVPNVWQALRDK